MFETLCGLLNHHGRDGKVIVWAHNSHIGNACATEMTMRGETNIGELTRKRFGENVHSVGFGTHTGTVSAATNWGDDREVKNINTSLSGSFERLCHDAEPQNFILPLSWPLAPELHEALLQSHLERAIGVLYRPETERRSHYFHAILPWQFDDYIWFDRTDAVEPIPSEALRGVPDTYPFGV